MHESSSNTAARVGLLGKPLATFSCGSIIASDGGKLRNRLQIDPEPVCPGEDNIAQCGTNRVL